MATPTLIIAGKSISIIARLDFDQRIEPIGGSVARRMANGAAFKITHWQKHRVVLSGSGWVPAPLNAIDYSQPFEIELPRSVGFLPGEPLPAGWSQRSGLWAERTVVDQAGQSVRLIFPKMTVISDGPTQSNGNSASPSWELICEVA